MDTLIAPLELYAAIDDADPLARLERIAALNRINALAAIRSAAHGWLGSCFSVCELLTTLYFHHRLEDVVLSKGHAAAMQYACLVGVGRLAADRLLTYKDGPAGLQAHTDRETPGVLVNTGSLGQALSKTAAIAAIDPGRHCVVILGDGELQEGQCFEGLQTVAHRQLDNLTVVIDRNGFQTARPTSEIKGLDEAALLRALGFEVIELDGHDLGALGPALGPADGHRPRAVVAQTIKGGGSPALATAGAPGQWHGRVPDDELARQVIDEQVARAALPALTARWETARRSQRSVAAAPSRSSKAEATGRHFSRALTELARARTEVVVLDADLVSPCGLEQLETELSSEERFFEMGIAEQDMVSFAGGLALTGKLPVVNTYASFYKRAVDQVFLNATEAGSRLIYAGHYAGLGYHSDGKTHQSLADLALMRAVPAMVVCDPVDRRQTEAMLAWAADEAPGAVYLRLRRAGAGLDDEPRLRAAHRDARAPWPGAGRGALGGGRTGSPA